MIPPLALYARHGVAGVSVFPVGFQSCFVLITLVFSLEMEMFALCHCIVETFSWGFFLVFFLCCRGSQVRDCLSL